MEVDSEDASQHTCVVVDTSTLADTRSSMLASSIMYLDSTTSCVVYALTCTRECIHELWWRHTSTLSMRCEVEMLSCGLLISLCIHIHMQYGYYSHRRRHTACGCGCIAAYCISTGQHLYLTPHAESARVHSPHTLTSATSSTVGTTVPRT